MITEYGKAVFFCFFVDVTEVLRVDAFLVKDFAILGVNNLRSVVGEYVASVMVKFKLLPQR